ncbi:O-acyltransferase like protein-like isoform X2 [Pieris brassicae]|uniref:O-acyltransferase like protein-like isoform X2 n=1 Tax=Pieris brassicae TaxID=7116 RepID=UPI001E65E4EB|nr:O-acyltransferase like protein-like isoform X2 [Pieris brassicae]
MKTLILLLSISYATAWLDLNEFPNFYPFDRELHKRVLNSELCEKQLNYLRDNDSTLLLNFLDAGARIPKGVFGGNFRDMGNFYQCLGIRKRVENMDIEGKYCTINIPLTPDIPFGITEVSPKPLKWSTLIELVTQNKHNYFNQSTVDQFSGAKYLSYAPYVMKSTRSARDTVQTIEVQLALCIPKACTTSEVLNKVGNITTLGLQYEDNLCRLPNDKHWVTADYIAIVVFSTFGLIILLSTTYDLHHIFYLKKAFNDKNMFRIFSAFTNLSMLCNLTNKRASLQCLDGIRAIAIFWVIIGHAFVASNITAFNFLDIQEWLSSIKSIWITGAPITVDTFFMISGLLLVYTSMPKYTSLGLLKNLHVFYLSRLLRMFPVLALAVLFEASLYNRISDGAFWHVAGNGVHTCRALWWSTLLHLQNFVNPLAECLPVTWYLAIDVQLHIISPIVLFWLLRGSKRTSWTALIIGFLVSIAIATTYIFLTDVHRNYFVYYYVNVLVRSPPFFVGMIVGYCLRVYRDRELNISTILSACMTTISLVLLCLVIYVNFLKDYSAHSKNWANSSVANIIDSFTRSIWSAALGWIIFMCVNGYGGPINKFLSMDMWKIASRISYAMYIIHFSVINAYFSSMVENHYFTVGTTVFIFFSCSVVTVVVSILLTGLIEIPFSILFKHMLDKVSVNYEKPLVKPSRPVEIENSNSNGNINDGFLCEETKSKTNL